MGRRSETQSAPLVDQLMEFTRAGNRQELSEIIGITPSMISRLCSGARDGLSLGTLANISERTGIKVSTLAGWWAGEKMAGAA